MPTANDNKAELITRYGAYVRSLANTVRKQFGGRLDLDDLVAYGNIGLFEADQRFDAKVGVNFLTFAHYRIKGAIFDGLRKMGTLRGGDAARTYIGERATTYLRSLSDSDTGRMRTPADDVRDVSDAVSALATVYATSFEAFEGLNIRDDSVGAEERLESEQMKSRVRDAIQRLPEKERTLLKGYYFEGKTLEEAGAAMKLSKSWCSRLHAQAVEQLRDLLEEATEASASSPESERIDPSAKSRAVGASGASTRR